MNKRFWHVQAMLRGCSEIILPEVETSATERYIQRATQLFASDIFASNASEFTNTPVLAVNFMHLYLKHWELK